MSSLVYVKNPNGTTYVYENTTYWDKKLKICKHKRISIGHLDLQTNEVVPNRKKGEVLQSKSATDTARKESICTVTGIGLSLLLDKMAEETSLRAVLEEMFQEDWRKMLACAYYLVSDGRALCHAEQWAQLYQTPCSDSLSSQRISELLVRITPSMQANFFKRWCAHHKQDEYYAMDITSVSSYSNHIQFVRWGYNRDGEELPQINLLMITGETSHLPLYYRIIPGSIKDVNTLKESLAYMKLIGSGSMNLVMDKGFYSADNINEMYAKGMKFIIGVPFTTSFAKEAVDELRENMDSHHNYCRIMEDELYATSQLVQWGRHRCYRHVYYDSLRAESEKKKFDHLVLCCYEELISGQRVKRHERYYNQFYIVKQTPKRGIKVSYNEDAINKYKCSYIGWFVLITNRIKDKVEALSIYRQKDAVEKHFDDLKNDLDMKRLRIHSEAAMDGRIFLQFLALVLSTQLKQVMHQQNLFKNYNMQEIIDEMKSLREVRVDNKQKRLLTHRTKLQQTIITAYGLGL